MKTIPDVNLGRQLYQLDDLSDDDVANAMFALQQQKSGNRFLPLHMHRIITISAVLHTRDKLKVWSLGEENSPEEELLQRFYAGIDRYTPTLVSWNGSSFDLPVMHYRSLHHGISAARYWETGDEDNSFRYNNYLSRYHMRHTDVMDVLAAYQMRANASLENIATLCGFPGKLGMSGDKVWQQYQKNDIASIRNYCETDVLNTFLVYLRFQVLRGRIQASQFEGISEQLRNTLLAQDKSHFTEFCQAWKT